MCCTKVEPSICAIYLWCRSINGPMSNWLQANDHLLPLEIPKSKKVSSRRCDGCLHEEFGMLSHKCCGEFRIYNGANAL